MGCGTSKSTQVSPSSMPEKNPALQDLVWKPNSKIVPAMLPLEYKPEHNASHQESNHRQRSDKSPSRNASTNSGIAFDVMIGEESDTKRLPPKRLLRLEPIDAPRLTAEELEEKQRLAERKRNSAMESRAKTASESRRRSKRRRELMIARELERQHQQARELEHKLRSAEKQREIIQLQMVERQKLQEEKLMRARNRKEKLLADDIISDLEQDENFNNDDVDSWLEGSNNDTNTVDTGFSSAASDRMHSGNDSPKRRNREARGPNLSASTVERGNSSLQGHHTTSYDKNDDFFDSKC